MESNFKSNETESEVDENESYIDDNEDMYYNDEEEEYFEEDTTAEESKHFINGNAVIELFEYQNISFEQAKTHLDNIVNRVCGQLKVSLLKNCFIKLIDNFYFLRFRLLLQNYCSSVANGTRPI